VVCQEFILRNTKNKKSQSSSSSNELSEKALADFSQVLTTKNIFIGLLLDHAVGLNAVIFASLDADC
jgi:hypothetical protein